MKYRKGNKKLWEQLVVVGSFVTDNAINISKMKKNLQDNQNLNILQYGCNNHIQNLLSKICIVASN